MKKNKVAIVIQRYGEEVSGGCESYARWTAERLIKFYEIEVLTTCALEPLEHWKNYYAEGKSEVNGIPVRRFKTEVPEVDLELLAKDSFYNIEAGIEQLKEKGPYSPTLLDFLGRNKHKYEAFLYFPYFFVTTVLGMHKTSQKNIVVPLLHDEPEARRKVYRYVFQSPVGIVYNSRAEKNFANETFANKHIPSVTIGIGVNIKKNVKASNFYKKYKLKNFVISIGRIESEKKYTELIDYFIRFKDSTTQFKDLKLVLVGKVYIDIPKRDDIVSLGFISDEDKFAAIKASKFLINPSLYESLSIVLLEAFLCQRPVLVNGNCAVLKDHCEESGGGFCYHDYESFKSKMVDMLKDPNLLKQMGKKGYNYADENYNWKAIEQKWATIIDQSLKQISNLESEF